MDEKSSHRPGKSHSNDLVMTALSVFGAAVYLWGAARVATAAGSWTLTSRLEVVTYMLLSAAGCSIYLLRARTRLLQRVARWMRLFGRIHLTATAAALVTVIVAAVREVPLSPIVSEIAAVGVATTFVTTLCLVLMTHAALRTGM